MTSAESTVDDDLVSWYGAVGDTGTFGARQDEGGRAHPRALWARFRAAAGRHAAKIVTVARAGAPW